MNISPVTKIPAPGLSRPVRIAHITDMHIGKFSDNDPGVAEMRGRMDHLCDKWGRDFEDHLEKILGHAWEQNVDAIFATGDIMDFPSPDSIHFVQSLFQRSPCPVFFISGNHDWNFPGQHPCDNTLRAAQLPLAAPLFLDGAAVGFDARQIGGLQILTVDNSTYQIDAAQLAFAQKHLGPESPPTVLLVHIPVTQLLLRERTIAFWGQPILMGDVMPAEIRRQWNVETPTPETAEFISLLRATPNLRAIFTGHVHFQHEEPFTPAAAQYVGTPGFEGGIRLFEFHPA